MIRRFAPWLGAFELALAAAFLAVFGRDSMLDPSIAVFPFGFAAAGVLSIVGGTVDSIPIGSRTIPWNVLVGTSNVIIALIVAFSGVLTIGVGDTGTETALVAVGMVVGAASLAWFGVQTARDGRHVDLEASPSRRRLVGIAALAGCSIGIGALVAVVVG